jgi:Mce-associated membrane protein
VTEGVSPSRVRVAFFGLCALLLVLVVASVLLGVQWKTERDQQTRYADILASARQEALAFTTLNYHNLDQGVAQVLGGATGSFRKQFKSSAGQLRQLATQNKSMSKGKVLQAGLVSSDQDSARVIVVADSTVSNLNTKSPQPRHYRLQLDLVRQGSRWLTSDLQFVG